MKLILKYVFYSLVKKNIFKYLLIFCIIIVPLALYLPIIQVENDFLVEHQKFYGNQHFDKYFKLPNKQNFLKIQKYISPGNDIFPDLTSSKEKQKNLYVKKSVPNYIRNYLIPKMKKELKGKGVETLRYSLVHKIFTYVFEEKNQFFLWNGNFHETDSANKFKITDGTIPVSQSKISKNQTDVFEAVLNTKYAKLNNIKLNSIFFIKNNFKLKVVGFVDFDHNLSLDIRATIVAQNSPKKYQKSADNIYANLGFFYLTNQDFWKIINQGFFFNYDSDLYITSDATSAQKNQFYRFIQDQLAEDFNYFSKPTDYFFDIPSGLKTTFSTIEIIFLGAVILVLFFFFCFFLIYLVNKSLTRKDFLIGFLNCFGYSKTTLAKSYFLVNFILFSFVTIIGYCLGFILNKILFLDNQKLYFIHLEYQPFDPIFFFASFFLFAFLPSVSVFLFVYFYLYKKSGKWLINKNKTVTRISWFFQFKNFFLLKLKKIFHFNFISIKFKLGISFFFQEFWKKLLFFFFLFLLIFSVLFVTFTKIASENFLNKQWNFLQPGVKSFTYFKNSIYFDRDQKMIVSNYKFEPFQKGQYENIEINEISNFFSKNENKIDPNCLPTPEQKQKQQKQQQCLEEIIKKFQNKRIVLDSIKDSKFAFFKDFGFENVYFHTIPYLVKEDFPVLSVLNHTVNGNITNSSVFFLPAGWENFFQISNLDDVLKGFSFQNYDSKNKACQQDGCLKIGQAPDGLPYILAPYYLKEKGYKSGDILNFKFSLSNTIDTSIKPRKFKIAGFIQKNLLFQNLFFADHEYFFQKSDSILTKKVYNMIFSKNKKKYLQRNVILDLTFFLKSSSDNSPFSTSDLKSNNKFPDLAKINIFNNDSVQLNEFENVLSFHLQGVQKNINITMILLILLSALFLLLMLSIWFDQKNSMFPLLKTFGYNWPFFFIWFFLIFLFLIVLPFFIIFLAGWFLYQDFFIFLASQNIYFYLFSLWQYFAYFAVGIFLIFFICCLNNFFFFKKVKKITF